MDQRKRVLSAWAQQCLAAMPGQGGGDASRATVDTVSGDASFRRYFRLRSETGSYILVDAPPAQEDCHRFVHVAQLFREAGLLTPQVLAVDYEQGFMLLEDFGDTLYLPVLQASLSQSDGIADLMYSAAMTALVELQATGKSGELAPYDRTLLRTELQLFDHWFCERFVGMQLGAEARDLLDSTWTFLEDSALRQPQVCVHRDYHSRNLMILNDDPGHAPGIIDFQDAVVGACTYDLVSLLRDCYIVWPQARVQQWALQFHTQASQRGVLPATSDFQSFMRDFDLMGIQRHIKVIGIFCRLNLRDGKPGYMADIPLVIDYVLSVAAGHPELAPFLDWFRHSVLPQAQDKLNPYIASEVLP